MLLLLLSQGHAVVGVHTATAARHRDLLWLLLMLLMRRRIAPKGGCRRVRRAVAATRSTAVCLLHRFVGIVVLVVTLYLLLMLLLMLLDCPVGRRVAVPFCLVDALDVAQTQTCRSVLRFCSSSFSRMAITVTVPVVFAWLELHPAGCWLRYSTVYTYR